MSFLFTFSLPRLPFPNPFSQTVDSGERRSAQAQGRGAGGRRPRSEYERDGGGYDEGYSRDVYGARKGVRREERWDTLGGGEHLETANARQNMGYSFDEQEYGSANVRDGDSSTRPFSFSRDTVGDDRSSRGPKYDSRRDYEEDERPAKRRRMGMVETVLTTAISVAIVSTAVGYTAYRMWRDGGLTVNPKAVEAAERTNEEDDQEEETMGRGERNTRLKRIVLPPPPPYAQIEPPVASPRVVRKEARAAEERRKHGKKRRGRRRADEGSSVVPVLPPSPLKRKMEEERTYDTQKRLNPVTEEDGDVLEEQMDWMSAQLQGLIENGRRALAKEISLGSESEDVTGWEDE